MNREILFRGKRMDNGQWVEGDLVRLKDGKKSTPHIYGYGEVDPNTVGQYTGLTDKNGRKVFEGDILKEEDIVVGGEIQIQGDVWSVGMRRGCWVVMSAEDWGFLGTNAPKCAIIGNIHDNPELLNQ